MITESDDLSPDVRRVRMRVEGAFACRGGQFISLIRDDDLVRPYSVARLPDRDGFLELHVRRTPNGRMSNWIHDQLQPGHRLHIRGPAGDCFYLPGEPDAPLLLVGTGTGLAPLYAVIQDALRHQHRGPLVLLHGALHEDGFYLVEELSRLAAQHPNLTYRRCLPEGTPAPGVDIGPLEALTRTHVPKPAAWRAYLCGNPTLVHSVRKQLFLAGAGMKRIHSDAFISAAPPAAPASG